MLYYLLFWTILGFISHFYIIFGTNILTGGPAQIVVFLPISVFRRKGISNGIQTEWNLREDPGDLEWTSRKHRGGHEAGGRAQGGRRAPHPREPLERPPTYFFLLYIHPYPKTIRGDHENLIPLPQPFVPVRFHLGAFSSAPSEGALITEGFYINTIASLMMCE